VALLVGHPAFARHEPGPREAVAVIRLDFDKVSSPADQEETRRVLCASLPKERTMAYCIGQSDTRMIPLTDDRARINAGRLVNARLLLEANVWHDTSPDDGQLEWGIIAKLFDAEGGDFVGRDELHCPGCTREKFVAKLPGLLLRLLGQDKKEPTAPLSVRSNPVVRARLKVDDRSMGELPFDETLFVGRHQLKIEADGYQTASAEIVLERGHPANVTLPLEKTKENGHARPAAPTTPIGPVVSKPPPSNALRISGGVLLGAGAAGIIAGAVSLSLDGRGTCQLGAREEECPSVYATLGVGSAVLAVGAVAAITGAVLLGVDAAKRRPSTVKARVGLSPEGAWLGVSGRF
jgi:hypothetical protein